MKSGNINFLEPSGPLQACNGTVLPLPLYVFNHFNRLLRAALLHVSTGLTIKNSAIRIHSLFRLCVSYVLKINDSYFLKQHLPTGFIIKVLGVL